MNKPLITVSSIEKWKNELPITVTSESTRSLYIMLNTIEKLDCTASEKYQLLTALHSTVTTLTHNLSHHYETKNILNNDQFLIYQLSNGLYQKMLNGFKTIVNETQHSILHPVLFLHALQSAMHYCIAMLFNAYKYHQQLPEEQWLNLHQFYFICLKKHLHHFNLKAINVWPYQMNNIENTYKHALLFSIVNPYRLRHEQIDSLISALKCWVPLLKLNKDPENALYFVDFNADLDPRYISNISDNNKKDLYYLHLEEINEHILKLVKFRKKENTEENKKTFAEAELNLPLDFLNNLLSTWQQSNTRITTRHKTDRLITGVPTLASIHWLMTASHSNDDDETQNRHAFYKINVIDESETGYCLAWPENSPLNLQSGETFGILHADDPEKKYWEVCVIRWIKQDQTGHITFGVHKLSRNAIAAVAQPTKIKIIQPIPILVLPKEEHKPLTLITPLLPFKAEQEIEIHYNEKTYLAELKYIREKTSGYQEFELNFIDIPFPV